MPSKNKINLYAEIADTPLKREMGLMGRKSLHKNGGMLFKFQSHSYLNFWMRNTYLPLDIAFVDDSGKVLQIRSMIPLSTRPVSSDYMCRFALEVNKGWFARNCIGAGSYLGGTFFNQKRIAQSPASIPQQDPMQEMNQPPVVSPDVVINRSFKEILENANIRGKDLVAIYQTKWGKTLPPKIISPPFTFENDAEGNADAIVKVWDNQTAGWKSFIIDNIIDLEEKEEKKTM